MEYSPKLKKAMEDIKDILKAADIAGIVILHTMDGPPQKSVETDMLNVRGFTEYLFHINTSYSAVELQPRQLVVKHLSADHPNKAIRDQKIAGAVSMMDALQEWTSKMALQAVEVADILEKYIVEKEVGDDLNTSHSQQNN